VGLAKHQPADKLHYLQQCLATVAQIGWQNVELNTFLNHASALSAPTKSSGTTIDDYILFFFHFIELCNSAIKFNERLSPVDGSSFHRLSVVAKVDRGNIHTGWLVYAMMPDYACCHLQAACLESGISSGPLRSITSMGNLYLYLRWQLILQCK